MYVNKKVQLDATVCRHLFTAKSFYLFQVSQHPSSGALKTVTATSGTGHNTGTATSFQRGLIRTMSLKKNVYVCRTTNQLNWTRFEVIPALKSFFTLASLPSHGYSGCIQAII